MEQIYTESDAGGILVGTKDFGVKISNGYGDGTTEIIILDINEELPKNAKYKQCLEGKFNIYNYDCSKRLDEDIVCTLTGRYGVFRDDYSIYFQKWSH